MSSLTFTVIIRGGGGATFYSGLGSHTNSYVTPYCELLKQFLFTHPEIKRVIDLGCGDFNVSSQWINNKIDYTGIDIVDNMIRSHQKNYGSEHVHFMCLDIVEDELPDGDLCVVRQVLQHLSNNDVSRVLAKLKKYQYVIITDSQTPKEKAAYYNADILTGHKIRTSIFSGLYLDEPPFSLETEILLNIPELVKNDRVEVALVTMLIRN